MHVQKNNYESKERVFNTITHPICITTTACMQMNDFTSGKDRNVIQVVFYFSKRSTLLINLLLVKYSSNNYNNMARIHKEALNRNIIIALVKGINVFEYTVTNCFYIPLSRL